MMTYKNDPKQIENGQVASVVLWGVSASPYVRKVMVALAEKEISYEHKQTLPKLLLDILGKEIPTDFAEVSVLGKIPALQVDDFCIADSSVITAYVDKKFDTGNRLYPSNPEEFARALWFEHYADNRLTEIIYKKIFFELVIKPNVLNLTTNMSLVNEGKEEVPALLNYLNESVSKFTWIAGETFSMADVAVTMQLIALEMAGYQIGEDWRELNQYISKIKARPSFQAILQH
jgi:glutathione S-transferase